jgi:hypothetical protein
MDFNQIQRIAFDKINFQKNTKKEAIRKKVSFFLNQIVKLVRYV